MQNLTIENFDLTIKNTKDILLVCFSTHWCPPCQVMKETLAQVEAKKISGATIYLVDADDQQELSTRFGVFSIPTTVFLKDGQEVARFVGAKSIETIEAKITSLK